jgi:hypothetical protein
MGADSSRRIRGGGALILSHLLVLEREGLSRDEVPLAGTLDAMLARHHNRMVDAGILERPAPFAETTDGFREFYGDYTRAFERRRPFWHWIAGTLGVVGLAGGAYFQFVEIPAVRESLDAEYERYLLATTVEEAVDALDRVESGERVSWYRPDHPKRRRRGGESFSPRRSSRGFGPPAAP